MTGMESKHLQNKNKVMAAVWTVVTFLCLFFGIRHVMKMSFTIPDNNIRVLLNVHKEQVQKGVYETFQYPYLVFSVDGRVLHREAAFTEVTKDTVKVQEMLTVDESFRKEHPGMTKEFFALEKDKTVTGFVTYLIPETIITDPLHRRVLAVILPLCIMVVLGLLFILFQTWYTNHRILKPIQRILVSTDQIIHGNYEIKADRVYETEIGKNEIGELTYSFESMRDELRQRRIREEELKKSQQEMISCISHDLKTPISTIMAYAEAIRDGIADSKEEEQKYLSIVVSKTHLLTDMIQELLEFSNAQLNRLDIVKKEVYLKDYMEPVLKELEGYVKSHDMNFSCDMTSMNPVIMIDKKRITQVLYNLVENSIKYSAGNHGDISVHVSWEEGHVLIRVKDRGIGVGADDIPYVFDKFYRGEKSRNLSIPGSGLGLSICKYIIEAHKGEIYCRNRKEGGCEFGFTIA